MPTKKSNVYACRVKKGEQRKGCGGGATVVELDKLKIDMEKLKAEVKRKDEAARDHEKRLKDLEKSGKSQQKRDSKKR